MGEKFSIFGQEKIWNILLLKYFEFWPHWNSVRESPSEIPARFYVCLWSDVCDDIYFMILLLYYSMCVMHFLLCHQRPSHVRQSSPRPWFQNIKAWKETRIVTRMTPSHTVMLPFWPISVTTTRGNNYKGGECQNWFQNGGH